MHDRIQCTQCKTEYEKMFLIGKQGNADICPMCGEKMSEVEQDDGLIDWYYYGFKDNPRAYSLRDNPLDLDSEVGQPFYLKCQFRAPPRDANGSSDAAKKVLRTIEPDAFPETPKVPDVKCPKCGSTQIQMVAKKWSPLTGFLTNKVDRVCMRCRHKF